jgi:hypothetical protein
MKSALSAVSLMLMVVLFFHASCNAGQPHVHKHQHFHGLAVRDGLATSTTSFLAIDSGTIVTATASPCSGSSCAKATHTAGNVDCAAANGTSYTEVPEIDNYTIICNIDFPDQNIYPFILAGSFEDCLLQCEKVNRGKEAHCEGFVFVPERIGDSDDCYLKSALKSPGPATISLIGATLATSAASAASIASNSTTPTTTASSKPPSTSTSAAEAPVHQTKFHSPKIASSQLLGPSIDNPTTQYVKHALVVPEKLASNLLVPGINTNLITEYAIAGDTGSWTSTSSPIGLNLANMSGLPHLSRDGGKGGCINGTHVFIFCDTATFQDGNMNGFVSSSIAVDTTLNGLNGNAIVLVDQIGEWQDDVGRMRGLSPMTTAEEAFNIQLSGQGYRYAVWPESSPILLNDTHALLYASLVYDEVDMSTQAANFTTLGNTVLVVSIDPFYGPGAQRVVNQMFQESEVAWGSLGGLRSWGKSGVGGMDGMLYLFGQVDEGVLVARTDPFGITNRSAYSYWDGSTWSSGMLPSDTTSYLLDEPVMDLDVFYSPYHGTFIMVYLTPNADNTFYFRYVMSDTAILPPYAGGIGDYVESIVKNQWSSEQVLYKAAAPPMAYIYAGGVHTGYFGKNDITNGGTKMLISWTEHTGQDAASSATGYSHMTAVVTLQ